MAPPQWHIREKHYHAAFPFSTKIIQIGFSYKLVLNSKTLHLWYLARFQSAVGLLIGTDGLEQISDVLANITTTFAVFPVTNRNSYKYSCSCVQSEIICVSEMEPVRIFSTQPGR